VAPDDRRFQVFVSSTFEDLVDQRKQAIEVIFERGHIPIALERFAARNESDLEVITTAIKSCQVYLLILGHRYGELVPGEEYSFTELEFRIARDHGLLILPLVLKPAEVARRRMELDSTRTKDANELKHFEQFERFRESTGRFRQFWGPDDQFKFLVANALNDNLRYVSKPGFVLETSAVLTSASSNEFIVDIVEQLQSFEKLDKRVLREADKKREVAAFFREHYLDRIIDHKVGLFIESGSTLAYVTKAIAETLSRVVKIKEGKANLQISTNNVLAYLELWLKARIPCTTFPWSPPKESTYGALYGGLDRIEDHEPTYDGSPLDAAAKNEIARMHQAFFSLNSLRSDHQPGLLLAATSGLQIGRDHAFRFDDGVDDETRTLVSQRAFNGFGPHVGSYRNKIFKRYMYSTEMPIVIFITEDKIDCPIEVGKCHFILDRELPWDVFCREHPVAFIVGCRQSSRQALAERFASMAFRILEGQVYRPITAFAARNDSFIERFERATDLRSRSFSS
jgi:hypothetical protein